MADFVRSYDDTRKSTSIFHNGNAVDFLQTLVNNASSSDVGKSYPIMEVNNVIQNDLSLKTTRGKKSRKGFGEITAKEGMVESQQYDQPFGNKDRCRKDKQSS